MAKRKDKKKNKQRAKSTLAQGADRYALYLASVQAPDVDVVFFNRVYKSNFGVAAQVLREDFCGTAAVCCEWVKKSADREAYGVDLDPEPLEWGRRHHVDALPEKHAARVHLIEGDVRTAKTPAADIVAAQNFSYCCFKQRDELRAYFVAARKHLQTRGVFILDLFGGSESIEDDRAETTRYKGFDYVWDQHHYDPVNAHCIYKIHFRFKDGSELKDAFVYDWRLWTIPEVKEVLLEAGFDRADVYWEGTEQSTGEGNGVYKLATVGDSDPAWNCYIVGVKGV